MRIRRAVEADLPRLVELWLAMMREHCDFEPRLRLTPTAGPTYQSYLHLHCRNPRSRVVLAETEDRAIGFCCAYVCQNLPMFEPQEFGYVSDLCVVSEERGRGLGTRILDDVRDWFKGQGVECVQLQVYDSNEKGRRFWAAKGFAPFLERLWLDL
ncbi:GNAT family N-acetyltransferase [Candidatus Sumerlaeota bacterium]|nr:GNAT family N-acetyltransferase [Candidatus Sumerlaeota bacterium]